MPSPEHGASINTLSKKPVKRSAIFFGSSLNTHRFGIPNTSTFLSSALARDMQVKSEKDYITHRKKSGYRSYHIIVLYKVETIRGTKEIPVEIQIRTLGMNFWAIIEHSLQYKYKGNIPEHVRARLTSAANALITLDNEMSSIHDEIIDAQNFYMVKANIVSDILGNIQNLYKVANKREIIQIQDEFYEIYQEGDISKLERFNRQLDIIAEGYRAQAT